MANKGRYKPLLKKNNKKKNNLFVFTNKFSKNITVKDISNPKDNIFMISLSNKIKFLYKFVKHMSQQ